MRQQFSKRKYTFELPNLSSIQLDSYDFLKSKGLAEVVEEVNPILDNTGRGWQLAFSDPRIDRPNTTEENALEKPCQYPIGKTAIWPSFTARSVRS